MTQLQRLESRAAAVKIVVAPLERHCTPPVPTTLAGGYEDPTYRALVADYVALLAEFPPAALEAGMRALLGEWTMARWPRIGEIRPYMVRARAELAPPRTTHPSRPPELDAPQVSDEERARVAEGFGRLKIATRTDLAGLLDAAEWRDYVRHGHLPADIDERRAAAAAQRDPLAKAHLRDGGDAGCTAGARLMAEPRRGSS